MLRCFFFQLDIISPQIYLIGYDAAIAQSLILCFDFITLSNGEKSPFGIFISIACNMNGNFSKLDIFIYSLNSQSYHPEIWHISIVMFLKFSSILFISFSNNTLDLTYFLLNYRDLIFYCYFPSHLQPPFPLFHKIWTFKILHLCLLGYAVSSIPEITTITFK